MQAATEESVRRLLKVDPAFVALRQKNGHYEIVLKKGMKLQVAFAVDRVLGKTRFVEDD